MAGHSYDIEVFGQSFRVRSEKSERDVRTVAAYVDKQMRARVKASTTVIPLRAAIMAALGIAEALFEQRTYGPRVLLYKETQNTNDIREKTDEANEDTDNPGDAGKKRASRPC